MNAAEIEEAASVPKGGAGSLIRIRKMNLTPLVPLSDELAHSVGPASDDRLCLTDHVLAVADAQES